MTCHPSLCHHRTSSQDKFLVLSSDGLYEYFTNKEVVDLVEAFAAAEPDGDPAHHLVGELVNRAARKAGEQPKHDSMSTHTHGAPPPLASSYRSRQRQRARSNRSLDSVSLALRCVAGMESHQLLSIPHGARRHYHDDVSVVVISFEGRIWRSSV